MRSGASKKFGATTYGGDGSDGGRGGADGRGGGEGGANLRRRNRSINVSKVYACNRFFERAPFGMQCADAQTSNDSFWWRGWWRRRCRRWRIRWRRGRRWRRIWRIGGWIPANRTATRSGRGRAVCVYVQSRPKLTGSPMHRIGVRRGTAWARPSHSMCRGRARRLRRFLLRIA